MNIKLISFNSLLFFLLLTLISNSVNSQNKLYSESKQLEVYKKMSNDYSNSQTEIYELSKKYFYKCSNQKLLIKEYNVWKQKHKTRIKEYSKEKKRYVEDLKKFLKEFEKLANEAENAVQISIDLCANVGASKIIKSESELQNLINIHNNYSSAAYTYDAIKSQNAYMYKYLLEFKNSKEFKIENCEKYLVSLIQYEDNTNKQIIYQQKYVDSINTNFKKLPIEQQQIKLDKAKENYFQKYTGFITNDTNLEYGKPLSTESIKNEIATVRKALNCYNEVTSKKTYHDYTNKKIKTVGSLWGNKRSGKWILYYPDGKVSTEAYYLSGKLEGGFFQYDKDGNYTAVGSFENDERTGQWMILEDNIKSMGAYKNDEQDGVWKEYYKDETLKSSTTFVNGIKVGWAEEYSTNGSPTKKGNYKKARADSYKPTGTWNYWTYNSNGELKTKETIDEDTGFNIGDYESYYENGDLLEKGKYVNGKRDGEWYFYIDFKKNKYLISLHPKEGKYKVIFKNGKPIKFKDVNSPFDSIEDEFFKLVFKNNCDRKIQVAIRYKNLEGVWETRGYYDFEPNEEGFIGKTTNRIYYYYAFSIDGKYTWGGDEPKTIRGEQFGFKKVTVPSNNEFGNYTKTLNCNTLSSFSIPKRQQEALGNLLKYQDSFGSLRSTSQDSGFKFDGKTREIFFKTLHTKNSFTLNGKTYFNVKFFSTFLLENVTDVYEKGNKIIFSFNSKGYSMKIKAPRENWTNMTRYKNDFYLTVNNPTIRKKALKEIKFLVKNPIYKGKIK